MAHVGHVMMPCYIRVSATQEDEGSLPRPISRINAEESLLEELKRLNVLSAEAVVDDLWALDLSRLDGYGMQEYWLVHARPKSLGMKKELFGARFTNRVEERLLAGSGQKAMMIKVG